MSDSSTTVLLVDDEPLVRAGLRALLEQSAKIRVVGESSDALDGIRQAAEHQPDIAIIDIRMPGLSGIDAVPQFKQVSPRTRVLIATQHESHDFVLQALRKGADGYITKSSDPRDLLPALDALRRGETYVTPSLAVDFLLAASTGDGSRPGQQGAMLARLTTREREVFQLIAVGRANKEIAGILDVTLGTVKKHRENLQRKLGLHSAAAIARTAIREGLLAP